MDEIFKFQFCGESPLTIRDRCIGIRYHLRRSVSPLWYKFQFTLLPESRLSGKGIAVRCMHSAAKLPRTLAA